MRSFVSFIFVLLTAVSCCFAQAETSNYATAIAKFKRYYNANQPDSLFGMFNSAVKNGLPLDKTRELFTQMHGQLGNLKQTTFTKYYATAGIYKAEYEKLTMLINLSLNKSNEIDGLYFNEYKPESTADNKTTSAKPSDVLSSSPITDPSLSEEPVTLKTLGGTLSGTLTTPKNATGKIPVVLFIAGSGPTDRNCNSAIGLKTDAFKYLAEGLGKAK